MAPPLEPLASRMSIFRTVLVLILAVGVASCTTFEDKRLRELLHDKGFGNRADGVATIENFITGGDLVQFLLDPQVLAQPGAQQLQVLLGGQPVAVDGTIFIPFMGPVDVLGMTERELTALVREQLSAVFAFPIELHARIIDSGKAVFMYGEIEGSRYVPLDRPDLTLLELIARNRPSRLANFGRIHLIRPDAENPLTVVINVREMLTSGLTTYNISLQPNDIIYVPPTFLGHVARLVEKLLEPLGVAVQTLFGIASVRSSYEILTGDSNALLLNRGFRF